MIPCYIQDQMSISNIKEGKNDFYQIQQANVWCEFNYWRINFCNNFDHLKSSSSLKRHVTKKMIEALEKEIINLA